MEVGTVSAFGMLAECDWRKKPGDVAPCSYRAVTLAVSWRQWANRDMKERIPDICHICQHGEMNRNTALVRLHLHHRTALRSKLGLETRPGSKSNTLERWRLGASTRQPCRMTRTSQISRAAVGAARAASRPSSGSPGGQFAASFKQTQSPAAQGLAPRNTPSRTTPTLRQPTRQLYNFSTVSLPTAHISSSHNIRNMTTDFKQQPHKLLVIPGPIEFSDGGAFREEEKLSETSSDERRAPRRGGSV